MVKVSVWLQKIFVCSVIFFLNSALISVFVMFPNFWYCFLPLLGACSLFNSMGSILLWYRRYRMGNYNTKETKIFTNFVYLLPCYNESFEELKASVDSLNYQKNLDEGVKKAIVVVCDGKVMGTPSILKNRIFGDCDMKTINIKNAYMAWDGRYNDVEFCHGIMKNRVPFCLVIKQRNYGKRDSLSLIRTSLYAFNTSQNIESFFHSAFSSFLFNTFENQRIEYIIGLDGDTIFHEDCAFWLLQAIHKDEKNLGCVGSVEVKFEKRNFLEIYQNAEYIFAQNLRRRMQSEFTKKVTCLSGCVQILRVCNQTCGELIMKEFYRLPNENENIFRQILSYASEDRNHVCIAQRQNGLEYNFIQEINAKAYTIVPSTFEVLLSQRRRWTLGACANDVLLLTGKKVNKIERLGSALNLLTVAIFPFIVLAQGYFVYTIIFHPSMLLLYLSIVMMIPFVYALSIPLFIKPFDSVRDIIIYYFGFLLYVCFGFLLNSIVLCYALINMDTFSWGKTRKIIQHFEESWV